MNTKKWYLSKGMWAGIIAIGISLYMGLDAALNAQFNIDLPNIPEAAFAILAALGLWGRVGATTKIVK